MTESGTVIRLPHLSSHVLHATLFKEVKNSAFLRQQLMKGNSDFEYAFLDASAVFLPGAVLSR
jgi:EKC/KEOPS complex subunit CGI121/TPRKB